MDKVWGTVGGFFRVFDVAFFLPGAVVLIGTVFSNHGWWDSVRRRVFEAVDSTTGSPTDTNWLRLLALALTAILLVYLAGLLCHALARLIRSVVKRHAPSLMDAYSSILEQLFDVEKAPPGGTESNTQTSERTLYLWNLTALCWNLAVASVSVAVIWLTGPDFYQWGLLVLPLGTAALLTLLGSEFRYYSERMDKKSDG